jgi:two-component system cell cycle sensor histidine kinase/response regulator CckA
MVSHSIRALLVEDNTGDARLLQAYLYEVNTVEIKLVHVTSLRQGLEHLNEPFDVVLLDLSLPDSYGLETLTRLQVAGTEVPIIVLTGTDDEELAIRAMQTGAQDYLVKGQFTGDLLVRSIRYAIERKRAAEDLRRVAIENRMLAQAIASSSEGIVITDPRQPDNPIIYANPAFTQISGYSIDEIVGRNCRFLQGPETDPAAVALMRERIAAREPVKVTLLNYRKDSQPFWNELRISPVFSEQGSLLYFIGIQTDVTEQKRSEEKIRQQAALIDIATDAILVQDLSDRILFWNKGAEQLYGWQAEAALGRSVQELIYPAEAAIYQEIQAILLQTGEWQGELEHLCRDRQKITVGSRWTLVRDEEGVPHSILVVNTDITEKKRLEAQFLRAQRLESIGTLAGGIAHDLNNVLAPILMSVQLLRRKISDEQGRQWLDTLETSVKRGADLVRQVLSFTKGMDGERIKLQPAQLILEIEKIVRETFPKSLTIRTSASMNELWSVLGDTTQLHQVLMNLCVNGRDAMPQGGTLNISARNLCLDQAYTRTHLEARPGPYVEITVADTGTGIAPEVIDRIFEPFFTTKSLGRGTGLGLSTALGIVKNHGGFINVYSEVGHGTEFKVYLPALQSSRPQSSEDGGPDVPTGSDELILVVDDESAICDTTQTALEAHNYRVLTAQNGMEAIALYVQHQEEIEVTLIDMMMPIMDGVTTIRTLCQINPQIKIVAVSGLASNNQAATAASPTGVKAFLPKPYTAETLLKTLHDVIQDTEPAS